MCEQRKYIYKDSMLHLPLEYLTPLDLEEYIKKHTIKSEEDLEKPYVAYSLNNHPNYGKVISLPREVNLFPHHKTISIIDQNVYHSFDFSKEHKLLLKNKTLRDYQVEPVEKVFKTLEKRKSGILECPAGGGKTNMGIWLTLSLNLKTLFICDQYELLEQAYERFINFGGIKPNILTSKTKENNNSGITLTLFQSLYANDNLLQQVKNDYGLIIIDECHISSAPSYNTVLSSLQGLRLGLTATDRRKDNLHHLYRTHIGKSIIRVEVDMLKCEVNWFKSDVRTDDIHKSNIPTWAKDVNNLNNIYYNKITTRILEDNNRNNFIINKLEELNNEGRTILLITKTIEHILYLQDELSKRNILSSTIHSKQKKKINDSNLKDIKEKRTHILLTVNKANKGMDIDILDTLILCSGGNNDVNWEQRIGRIQRFLEDKKTPLIIDISDQYIEEFSKQAKNRSAFYFKLGFKQSILNK